jgi:hypothetical protein
MRSLLFRTAAVLGVLGLASGVFAQTFQGGVRGIIQDADGGVLPGVSVTLENEDTGVSRTAVSTAVGEYNFANVQPGTYTLQAELSGFAPFRSEGLIVGVSSFLVVDATLSIGGIEETVTVIGETPLIETATASVSSAVSRAELEVLPTPGRNVFIMSVGTPNVVHTGDPFWVKQSDQTNSSLLSLGGGPLRGNNYTVDGVSTTDLRNRTVIIPVFEAVQEMKVQINTYDAEMGRTGGGVFNVIHRTGTNAWAGSALHQFRTAKVGHFLREYYYHTAQDVAAGKLSESDVSDRPYILLGGSFGGPIFRDRTFFWISGEGYNDDQASNVTITLPTPAEAAGDFSASGVTIYNPHDLDANGNRRPFPGNVIPAHMIDPVGSSFARLLTELGPGGDIAAAGIQRTQARQLTGNLSHAFSDAWQSSLTYLYYTSEEPAFGHYKDLLNAETHPAYGIGAASLGRDVHAIAFNNTFITGDTSVLTLRYGQTFFNDSNSNPVFDQGAFTGLGFQGSFVDALYGQEGYDGQFPSVDIAEFGDGGDTHGSWSNNDVQWTSREVNGTFSQFLGNHTVKYGVQYRRMGLHSVSFRNGLQIGFDRKFTQGPNPTAPDAGSGSALADALLGIPNSGSATVAVPADVFIDYYGAFVQDDWRPSENLVLNLGLRVEHETGLMEETNAFTVGWDRTNPFPAQVNLDPAIEGSLPGFPLRGGLMYAGVDGYPTNQWDPPGIKLGPRIGFAYTVNPETVVRGGYAVFWAPYAIPSGVGADHVGNHGFTAVTSIPTSLDGVTPPAATAANPFPNGVSNPVGAGNGRFQNIGGNVRFNSQFRASPYIHKWSLDVQRDIGRDLAFKVGYVGSQGADLPIGGTNNATVNINQLADQYIALGDRLNDQYPNPFYGDSRFGSFSGSETLPLGQLLRPFPHFRNVLANHVTSGKSLYNSARIEFEKRFRDAWGARINYTMAVHKDNIYESNTRVSDEESTIFNTPDDCATGKCSILDADYGFSRIHVPHQFNIAFNYRIPGDNPIYSGWSISTQTILRSGFPLTLKQSSNPFSSYGFDHQRPSSGAVSGGGNPGGGSHLNYLSQGGVTETAGLVLGSGPHTSDDVRTPVLHTWDVSLDKTTAIFSDVNLNLRFEMLNLFNSPNWCGPRTVVGAGNFGQIQCSSGFPRTLQFMTKITF